MTARTALPEPITSSRAACSGAAGVLLGVGRDHRNDPYEAGLGLAVREQEGAVVGSKPSPTAATTPSAGGRPA